MKYILGMSPGKDGICSLVITQDGRMVLNIYKHVCICQISLHALS
jgi:hypothetical protein